MLGFLRLPKPCIVGNWHAPTSVYEWARNFACCFYRKKEYTGQDYLQVVGPSVAVVPDVARRAERQPPAVSIRSHVRRGSRRCSMQARSPRVPQILAAYSPPWSSSPCMLFQTTGRFPREHRSFSASNPAVLGAITTVPYCWQ